MTRRLLLALALSVALFGIGLGCGSSPTGPDPNDTRPKLQQRPNSDSAPKKGASGNAPNVQ